MAVLKLANVSKAYSNTKILNNINFECENELISLLGPSGCGKTTCLRTIAGFEIPSNGKIFLNGNDITNIPPNKRNIGMVFQSYALFPHLNVYENVAYGLKIKKLKKNEIKEKVKDALNMVNLEGFENYNINELSGGMQQRVAVARALVIEPEVLLLDEPLSNLDAKLRIKMRRELKKLQRDLDIPSIYVTHDQEEALTISDRIGVMNNGKIEQLDRPENIYTYPKTEFIANFIGNINEVSKNILTYLNIDYDKKYKYFVRPENVVVGKGDFTGKIVDIEYLGNLVRYAIKYDDNIIISEIHNTKTILKEGDEVSFNIEKDDILKLTHKI
ncbi:ABC transporter related [Methanococcus aeolicus Nankai-3]|uniref:Molybdate/tungstate import ATP-binding protein WtpC n=1 Tax=Methanococcus aeolicus (strain ATCC BAA-1280 / DSM 17508 / OCM 812 / Nankai-3) TaxID=419665 RepID=A6UTV1_META3|nr:ABC transporter ATP-binding protein [Methanococcus aeolicus]ABR55923.1 ABC transporter related [Methanococcus aeolicus Nankai-3]